MAIGRMLGPGRYVFKYTDGHYYFENVDKDELETTGISYILNDGTVVNAGGWYTTENSIRAEQGEKKRIRYFVGAVDENNRVGN